MYINWGVCEEAIYIDLSLLPHLFMYFNLGDTYAYRLT